MPVYEYRCPRGHQYEKVESFQAPTEQACPRCGSPARRLISRPAVIFKGPGFYSTDNRKGSTSGESGDDGAKADAQPGGDRPTAAGDSEKAEAGAV